MPKRWLENKKIVIIGGTTGIGFSAARQCINEGASVVIVGLDKTGDKQLETLPSSSVHSIIDDATDPETAVKAIETCVSRFGGFDAMYHVAGGSGRKFGDGPIHDINEDGWMKTLHWNLDSLMYSNRAAIKFFMKEKQAGVILNMSSVLGFSPSPHFFSTHAYAASKSAIIGLSTSMASYYAPYNIRVNVIAPGLVESPMSTRAMESTAIMKFISTKQPLDGGRVAHPEDLDGTAVFLLSDRSALITGQVIAVDGGWTVTEGQFPSE